MNPKHTWMNGRVTPWEESLLHVGSDAVLRGASVFEATRAYRSADGGDLLLFRLADDWPRLFGGSLRVLRMRSRFSPDQLTAGGSVRLDANSARHDADM